MTDKHRTADSSYSLELKDHKTEKSFFITARESKMRQPFIHIKSH